MIPAFAAGGAAQMIHDPARRLVKPAEARHERVSLHRFISQMVLLGSFLGTPPSNTRVKLATPSSIAPDRPIARVFGSAATQ